MESQWVGGHAIALMGICDPEGSYEVCYADASQGSEAVRERVAAAAARAGRDGPPTVSIVLTNGHEMTSLRGIQAALGEEAHLVGGSIFLANPPGLAVSPGGGEARRDRDVRRRYAPLLAHRDRRVRVRLRRGRPTGGTPADRPSVGARRGRRDHGPLHEREGGVVVKTIDGRPASEVWLSWIPEKDSAASALGRRP